MIIIVTLLMVASLAAIPLVGLNSCPLPTQVKSVSIETDKAVPWRILMRLFAR